MTKSGFVLFAFCSSVSFAQSGSVNSVSFERKGTYQIASGTHIAFPSIIKLPNDSLMVVYRKGSSHVEPSGRIIRQFGSPDGKFWTSSTTIVDTPGVDDRDPSITLLTDGRIMLTYYTYRPGNSVVYPPLPAIYSIHVAFSSDGGHTFSVPVSIDGNTMASLPPGSVFTGDSYTLSDGSTFQTFATSSPAVEVNNRIVIPAYGGNAVLGGSIPGTIISAPNALYFFESFDNGISWSKYSVGHSYMEQSWRSEPSLVKLSNGNFLMHYRCADDPSNPMSPGPMRQAFLGADLYSFVPDQDFSFTGHAPDLIRLSSGILVSAFRHVNTPPFGQDVCMIYSIDEGVTWSDTIRIIQGTTESGYPSFSQISPNKLLVSYYTSGGWKINSTIYNINLLISSAGSEISTLSHVAGIGEESSFGMTIYPNPCKDVVNINLNSNMNSIVTWKITDLSGRLVRSDIANIYEGVQNISFEIDGLPSGNYILSVSDNKTTVVKKLVVVD